MTERKPEKKVVSRTVAIALGIICIILIACLGGAIGYYTKAISDKNQTITSLNNTVSLEKYAVWVDNQTVSQDLVGTYASWKFSASVAGYLLVVTTSTTNYTYVQVIYNATIPIIGLENGVYNYQNAYYNYQYDNQVNVPSQMTYSIFSVLPSQLTFNPLTAIKPTNIEIRVGNNEPLPRGLTPWGLWNETVTIAYYY
jgi:hypothetical protein